MDSLLKDVSLGAITLFAENLNRSKAFYLEVFGKSVIFEDENSAVFTFGDTVINVLAVAAAPELVGPGTVAPAAAGTRAVMSVQVPDVDATCAQLAERGVTLLNGPVNRPWGLRTASFTDPGGHLWEIVQPTPSARGAVDLPGPDIPVTRVFVTARGYGQRGSAGRRAPGRRARQRMTGHLVHLPFPDIEGLSPRSHPNRLAGTTGGRRSHRAVRAAAGLRLAGPRTERPSGHRGRAGRRRRRRR